MATHTSGTNPKELEIYQDRVKNLDLIWCSQVYDIINSKFPNTSKITLNDFGCNYGQFYKEIKRRNAVSRFEYFGFDIDQKFLDLGIEHFPELSERVKILNVEKSTPNSADVSICSATFEHMDRPDEALQNMLDCSKQIFVLRTFVGAEEIKQVQADPKYVSSAYNINQFGLFNLVREFYNKGFFLSVHPDRATNGSEPYELWKGSGVERQMHLIVGTKIKE